MRLQVVVPSLRVEVAEPLGCSETAAPRPSPGAMKSLQKAVLPHISGLLGQSYRALCSGNWLSHQAKVSARDAERGQAARARQHTAAVREAERAQKAAEQAAAQAARSSAADRKQLEKAVAGSRLPFLGARVSGFGERGL